MGPIDIHAELARFQAACEQLRGADYCTPTVVQALAAVSRHESGFSRFKPFYKHPTETEPEWYAWNFGAMQCGARPDAGACPEGCFPANDSGPTQGTYLACFQVHESAEAGVLAFVRLMTVQRPRIAAALPSGDVHQIAVAMYLDRYYEGQGATVEARQAGYAKALLRNGEITAKQAGQELRLVLVPPAPPPPLDPSAGGSIAAGFLLLIAALVARAMRRTDP